MTDDEKRELIAEAGRVNDDLKMNALGVRLDIIDRLADALDAATRVPAQGEPNDELIEYALDYIENGTMRPERRKALQALASRATVPDAALAEAKKQLGEIQRHFTAIAGSGEIRVYEDTGEKHGIDYQSSVWAKRGERMTRDLIEFLGGHHRPEPVGNGESK